MTPAQLSIIKADILANGDMNTLPANSDGSFVIAALYNQKAVPDFVVWRTDASVSDILDGIDLSKYTPTDIPTTVDLPATSATWLNRSQNILIKQGNLVLLTQGRDSLNTAKVTIRGSIRDAITAIPAGASGANTSPGGASGANVLNACTRLATRGEKLLATALQGSDTTGTVTARVMGFEGNFSPTNIDEARAV